MDSRIKKNIINIMIFAAGILTGLTIIWKYPKVYIVLMFILAIGFILISNNIIFSKEKDSNNLIIKIR